MLAIEGEQVRLRVRPDTCGRRCVSIGGSEFVSRLLQHVLPPGFKRIRHYGLLAPAAKTQRLSLARQLLERVGLAEKFDAWPDQLSGGQQQRVAIARALAMQPSVMLCDEITSALDPELVGEVLRVVEGLADEGMTLLMVTHEMNFARKVADRVVFMHAGRIHEMGPPATLFGDPQTAELKQFLSALH